MSDLHLTLTRLKKEKPRTFACRRRKLAVAILKILLIEAVVWTLAIASLWGRIAPICVLGGVFGITLPLFIVKPWTVFRRQYIGRITDGEVFVRFVNRKGYAKRMTEAAFIRYTVIRRNGKKHRFELPSPYAVAYGTDDEVVVLAGLACPLNLTPRDQHACPKCNALTPTAREDCIECGSLMDEACA